MAKNTLKTEVKPELLDGIKELCSNNRDILMVSLCTTDGFNIKSFAAKSLGAEADKVAAVASTLCALSDSSSKQIMQEEFEITTIENSAGNILFASAEYLGLQCVLTVAAKSTMSLATARYTTKRLAKMIRGIEN